MAVVMTPQGGVSYPQQITSYAGTGRTYSTKEFYNLQEKERVGTLNAWERNKLGLYYQFQGKGPEYFKRLGTLRTTEQDKQIPLNAIEQQQVIQKLTPAQQLELARQTQGVPIAEVARYEKAGYTNQEAIALAQRFGETGTQYGVTPSKEVAQYYIRKEVGIAPPFKTQPVQRVMFNVEQQFNLGDVTLRKVTEPLFFGVSSDKLAEAMLGKYPTSKLVPSQLKELQIGIVSGGISYVREKPFTNIATIYGGYLLGTSLALVSGGAKVFAGVVGGAKGIKYTGTAIKSLSIGTGTLFLGAESLRIGGELYGATSVRDFGKITGKELLVGTEFIYGAGKGSKLISENIFYPRLIKEPVPITKFTSKEIILQRIDTGETFGQFKLYGETPSRKAIELTGEQFYSSKIRTKITGQRFKETALDFGKEIEISPKILSLSKSDILKLKGGMVKEGGVLTLSKSIREGLPPSSMKMKRIRLETKRMPTFSEITGGMQGEGKAVKTINFESLSLREQKVFLSIGERKAGRPVRIENLGGVLGKESKISYGKLISRTTGRIPRSKLKPSKGLITFNIPEKKFSLSALTSVSKEIKLPQKLEEEGLSVIKHYTSVEDISNRMFIAKQKIPVIKGRSIIKSVDLSEGKEIGKWIQFEKKPKQILQEQSLQLIEQLKLKEVGAAKDIISKLPKPISSTKILQGIKQESISLPSMVGGAGLTTIPYAGTMTYETYESSSMQIGRTKPLVIEKTFVRNIPFEISKLTPKIITKEISKEITKEITKTIPKEVTKEITKSITKQISKQIPKLITKQITKTISKPITLPFRPFIPRTTTTKYPTPKYKYKQSKLSTPNFYGVQVRRHKKFSLYASGLTLEKAMAVGKQKVISGLGATYKIIGRPSTGLKTPTGFYPKYSKKEGLVFIQKKELRLGTIGEREEIIFAKQMKGGIR